MLNITIMEIKKDYSQCRQCKFFVEDDEALKNSIAYCILLGINIDDSGNCADFIALEENTVSKEKDSDPEPVS